MKLPIVDYTSPYAAQDFTNSLHETGFGVLKNYPISINLLEKVLNDWRAFFQTDDKFNYVYDADRFDGYFSSQVSETAKGSKSKDLKEFFHVYPWGKIPEYLRSDILDYYAQSCALAAELLLWVERHTPVEISAHYSQSLSSMIEGSEQTLLRVLHYPPLDGEQINSVRAAAHADINLLTLLPSAKEPGLQVKTHSGDWFDVPCDSGLLIVNIGDMLQEASRGYYPSTMHRVVNPEGLENNFSRLSLPLFLHPKSEVVLSEKYTAQQYLNERLRELGMKS